MDKYQNKYRIPAARWQSWDYFTLCTQKMAQTLHCNVSMPNHTHGILIIDKSDVDDAGNGNMVGDAAWNGDLGGGMGNNVETLQCNVSTLLPNGPNPIKNEKMAKISPKSGTLSTIIRSYKSVVSKNARLIHSDFKWQPRFHDTIIRDAQSFENIQNYITNNPINWKNDNFNQNNG